MNKKAVEISFAGSQNCGGWNIKEIEIKKLTFGEVKFSPESEVGREWRERGEGEGNSQ
jgi:hypothetical protein